MRAPMVRKLPPNTTLECGFTAADVQKAVAAAGTIKFNDLEARFGSKGVLLQTLASLKRQQVVDYNSDWRTLDNLIITAR